MLKIVQTPIPIFTCPSRRPPRLYPYENTVIPTWRRTCDSVTPARATSARTDYAGNAGNLGISGQTGPADAGEAAT